MRLSLEHIKTGVRGLENIERTGGLSLGGFLYACIFFMIACITSGCSEPGPDIREKDDPAMQQSASVPLQPDSQASLESADTAIAAATVPERSPNTPYLNETGDQMFVPGRGWLATDEFWELYENDPARLPEDLDFHAIHLLRDQLPGDERGEKDAWEKDAWEKDA